MAQPTASYATRLTPQISAALAEVVQRHLGVPANRLYIKVTRGRVCGLGGVRVAWSGVAWSGGQMG